MIETREEFCARVSPGTGIVPARSVARSLLNRRGIGRTGSAEILLIVNELANNIIRHGREGKICIYPVSVEGYTGFLIRATDSGPGIKDLEKAMRPGESEDNGLGLGLSAVKRIADDVRVSSMLEGGTQVEVWKWLS